MNWFEGSIPDAINEAKRRSLVFVVVITGDDAQSRELLSTWDDPGVTEAARDCVAIKLHDKSEACGQFSQIYPVVCVPSSFFIGDSGVPLEVIASSISAPDLVSKIQTVKQMHRGQTAGGAVQPSTSSNQSPSQTPETPAAPVASSSSSFSSSAVAPSPAQEKSSSVEERAEQRKTPEGETKGELERRKLGKELQDFKRKQEEDQTKRLLEERQKEKEEERAARERVRQQIALDRAERAARYSRSVQEEAAAKEARTQAQIQQQENKKEEALRQRSSVARLQFRLPDGSSISSQFSAQSLLKEVLHFAQQEIGSAYGNFTMATMFPRREFSSQDLDRTLTELELAPSASIVILPESCRPPSALAPSSSSLWTFLGTLFYPLLAVWRILSSFIFGSGSSTGGATAAANRTADRTANRTGDRTQRESLTKQSLEKQPKNFKKDGKICRLRTQEDSEDENNTWNGNSTQQM
ncbi:UBX domain-containing protein 4 [Boleophthalmus pectinirostris]|uniref:UBX domain-containing protein 4 n=1 Tax=Boleophthalmus pectinirostris TaxID=150288 RepID=UPI00242C0715|nr:UBX domain-containing protein 4 [Boleophthalmus pectinirostris]